MITISISITLFDTLCSEIICKSLRAHQSAVQFSMSSLIFIIEFKRHDLSHLTNVRHSGWNMS